MQVVDRDGGKVRLGESDSEVLTQQLSGAMLGPGVKRDG